MEAIMAGNKRTDFEQRYFTLIEGMFGRLEDKIDRNTTLTEATKAQAEKTNGRVTRLEKEVFGHATPKQLPPLWRDPKVLSIVFNVTLALLVLIIAATKVNVTELVP